MAGHRADLVETSTYLYQLNLSVSRTDVRLETLIQDYSRREQTELLSVKIEQVKQQREDLGKQFRELVIQFCTPWFSGEFDFIEDDRWQNRLFDEVTLGQKSEQELDALMGVLPHLKNQHDEIKDRVEQLVMEMEQLPEPRKVEEAVALKIKIPKIRCTNMVNKQREVEEVDVSNWNQGFFLEALPVGLNPLRDIIIRMYGYVGYEAEEIVEQVWTRKPPVKKMMCCSSAKKAESRFHALKLKLSSNAAGGKDAEIPHTIRDWASDLEADIFSIINWLRRALPGRHPTAWADLCTRLDRLRDDNNGMVPAVVYRVLKLLEEPSEATAARGGNAVMNREQLEETLERVCQVVENLRFVMYASGIPNAASIQRQVLEEIGEALVECERELEEIQSQTVKRRRDEEEMTGKGKKRTVEQ